jgi:hypothetical protein
MTEDAWKIEAMKASMKNKAKLVSLIHPLILKEYVDKNASRDTDHFHPSEICKRDWCVRQSGYRMMGYDESNPERPKPFKTLNIFEEGNRIHRKWQGWLQDAGVLHGQWYCYECEDIWYGESTCPKCQSKQVQYHEVPLYDEDHHLLGHADGHVVLDTDYLIEIKSVGIGTFRYENFPLFNRYATKDITADQMWNEVNRPFLSHLKQGTLYMHVTGIHKMIFIYEWKASQDIKEFVVSYQPEVISGILATCDAGLRDIVKGVVPPRPEWIDNKNHQACKYCAYRTTCWSSDDVEGPIEVQPKVQHAEEAGGRDAGSPDTSGRTVRRGVDVSL